MTVIILDIDGVINPWLVNKTELTAPGFEPVETKFRGRTYIANLNPEHKTWIERVSKIPGVRFVWGSAWMDQSNIILKMWGIKPEHKTNWRSKGWDWIHIDTEDVGLGTWKIKSIKRWVQLNVTDPTEKIVWLDDDLEGDAFKWAEERGNMLCVAPERYTGLTTQDLTDVEMFVREN